MEYGQYLAMTRKFQKPDYREKFPGLSNWGLLAVSKMTAVKKLSTKRGLTFLLKEVLTGEIFCFCLFFGIIDFVQNPLIYISRLEVKMQNGQPWTCCFFCV